eukprot:4350_1
MCACNVNECTCNVKHMNNQIYIPDPAPPTFNIPPNNDIIMNECANKIKKVHFNDTIAIINDDDNTNKSDNCVADEFNEFHHNIIIEAINDKPDAAINDKCGAVINNGVNDSVNDNGQINVDNDSLINAADDDKPIADYM